MKKMLMYILTIILILTLPVVAAGARDDAWYTMEDDVLTVRIPLADIDELSKNTTADPALSYDVEFTDSPQGTFELIASEIQNDCWIASYRVIAEYSGPAALTFTTTCDDGIWSRYALEVLLGESGMEVSREIRPWFGIYDGKLRLSLSANPSTGYEWKYEISAPDTLELVKAEYVPDTAGETMIGAGGLWTAEFGSVVSGAGEVTLVLRYCRDWEDTEPAQEYSIQLQVDENGGVRIKSIETIFPEADEKLIDSVSTEMPSEPEPVE